jgi:hypothetical protein
MPQVNQLHVNQLLSNVSLKYSNAEYIWDKVFPKVPVVKESDLYRVYERNFRIPETKRAIKGVAREFQFDVSSSSYVLEAHALKDYVGDDEADNYDQGSLDVDTTENLTDAIMRRIEDSVAKLFTTTSWSLNVSLAAAWSSNTTTTNPIPYYDTGASTIIANSGYAPNFAILPRDGFVAVKNHVSVLDRVKYTSTEISQNMIASLIGVVKDTSAEGATSVLANFYGSMSFLGWKPSSPGLKTPSCGYTFMKSQAPVRKWRVDERKANAIEVEYKFVPKVVASLTGYLINGIV